MRILLAALALIVVPSLVEAQSGVQWTRARDATLVSKDVGAERWSITYRLDDGHVTGNVFRTDGGQPSFLDCDRTGRHDQLRRRCNDARRGMWLRHQEVLRRRKSRKWPHSGLPREKLFEGLADLHVHAWQRVDLDRSTPSRPGVGVQGLPA